MFLVKNAVSGFTYIANSLSAINIIAVMDDRVVIADTNGEAAMRKIRIKNLWAGGNGKWSC
ncbi:MAG: hypothetical protein ACXVAY_20670 [Mucilaginibacter sp.]